MSKRTPEPRLTLCLIRSIRVLASTSGQLQQVFWMSESKSFIKASLQTLIGQGLIYTQGIFLMPILVKSLGTSVYGAYTLLISSMSFIFCISNFGTGYTNRRFLPSAVDIRERRKLLYPQMIFNFISIGIISLLLILAASILKGILFKNTVEFSMFLVVLFLLCYLLWSQATDYFRYTGRIDYFNYSTVLEPYIYIAAVLICFYYSNRIDLNLLLLLKILSVSIIALPLAIKMFKDIGFNLEQIKILSEIKNDFYLGIPLLLGFLADFILSMGDRYVIAFYMSTKEVGYYNPAYTLGSLIIFIPKVFGVVLPIFMAKAIDKNDEQKTAKMVNWTINGFLLVCIPYIIGSYVLGKPILNILANNEIADNAYLVVPIVSLGSLFYGLNLILCNIFFVRIQLGMILKVNLIAALINLLLNFALLYFFRYIIVAAITTALSYTIAFFFIRYNIKFSINLYSKILLKSFFAAVAMGAVLMIFFQSNTHNANLFAVIGEIILGCVIYVALMFVFKAFPYNGLYYMKKLLKLREA